MPNRSCILSFLILGIVVGVLTVFSPAQALARPTEILVPAYFYPTLGNDWNRLGVAARQVSLTAILNPNSGPGKAADRNYVKATNNLLAAGGRVVGYVHTSYGARDLTAVKADIARYVAFYKIDGFFIDEMSNKPSEVGYYATLYSYIKSLNPRYRVIGNPGTSTLEAYLTNPTADILVTFEGTNASYANAAPPIYTKNYPMGRFANIVYSVTAPSAMISDLSIAASRNVGMIYLSDNTSASNPYSGLPTYFDQEVAAVKAAVVMRESNSTMILTLGFIVLAAGGGCQRKVRRLLYSR